jgi:very-short-patch-repair endonuclease
MTTTTTIRARALRNGDNAADRAMWAVLKGRQLAGYKFTRQLPIGPYLADFVCPARGLVLEIDGGLHLSREAHDRARDEYIINAGYAVFRVPAGTVLSNREGVCDSLLAVLDGRMEDDVEGFDLRYRAGGDVSVRRGFGSRIQRAERPQEKCPATLFRER